MPIIPSDEAWAEISRLLQRLRSLTGEGVENADGSISINPAGPNPPLNSPQRGAQHAWFRVQSVETSYFVGRRYDARNDQVGSKDVSIANPLGGGEVEVDDDVLAFAIHTGLTDNGSNAIVWQSVAVSTLCEMIKNLPGFDATKIQVLVVDNGTCKLVNTEDCVTS